MKYKNIVFEGNIGSGKTTLATALSERLSANLILEQFKDNVWLPSFYQDPLKYALPLELSFLMERHEQLSEYGSPVLNELFVSDYFYSKCEIFARMNLSTEEFLLFRTIANGLNRDAFRPDIVFYLDSDEEWLLKNISKRGRNYEMSITKPYLEKIRKAYLDYFNEDKSLIYVVLDAQKYDLELVSENAVVDDLLGLLKRNFKQGLNFEYLPKN